jgi:superfamily I DNA and/or RNA helicase
MVEKLSRSHVKMVRLGHPARLLPSILDHSLDLILNYCERGKIVADIRQERDTLLEKARKIRDKLERKKIYQEAKLLRKEISEREKTILKDTLASAQVILSTLTGSGTPLLADMRFDYVIIDEVSQAKEAECWIAILKGDRLIAAGDPFQLPPTIKSSGMTKVQLEKTLFHRLVDLYGPSIQHLLTIQYRMNSSIMSWSSSEFYAGKLIAHPAVANWRLCELPNVVDNSLTRAVLILIDTAGCDCLEATREHEEDSKYNENEAILVQQHIEQLIQAGVSPADIGVITPYNAQVCFSSVMEVANHIRPLSNGGGGEGYPACLPSPHTYVNMESSRIHLLAWSEKSSRAVGSFVLYSSHSSSVLFVFFPLFLLLLLLLLFEICSSV